MQIIEYGDSLWQPLKREKPLEEEEMQIIEYISSHGLHPLSRRGETAV